jgi:hypothetical protein
MTATGIAGIESLADWDTPSLSNALDTLRLRPHNIGYSNGSIQPITEASPCGCAHREHRRSGVRGVRSGQGTRPS